MRIQKPIKNRTPRKKLSACAIKEIRIQVEQASREFKVSKSFVIAVALANFFKIKNQEVFY